MRTWLEQNDNVEVMNVWIEQNDNVEVMRAGQDRVMTAWLEHKL